MEKNQKFTDLSSEEIIHIVNEFRASQNLSLYEECKVFAVTTPPMAKDSLFAAVLKFSSVIQEEKEQRIFMVLAATQDNQGLVHLHVVGTVTEDRIVCFEDSGNNIELGESESKYLSLEEYNRHAHPLLKVPREIYEKKKKAFTE
ncbi:MAG: hypothetical protein LBI53_07045 [Candidatus Peribacteria bacterium]|jgi:hypothetical protein|nr:hypothetical protein [Candidatus Peribacteria bacterium]